MANTLMLQEDLEEGMSDFNDSKVEHFDIGEECNQFES